MARIAGVKATKNAKGKNISVTIDLTKRKDAIPLFTEIGLLEKTDAQKRIESNEYMNIEDARRQTLTHIKQSWEKWKESQ